MVKSLENLAYCRPYSYEFHSAHEIPELKFLKKEKLFLFLVSPSMSQDYANLEGFCKIQQYELLYGQANKS